MSCKPRLFLSGPITGLSYEDVTVWREKIRAALEPLGIDCFSPLRGLEGLLRNETTIKESYQESTMGTDSAITDQDLFDILKCDVLLINLLGTSRVSIGTVFEAAWAYLLKKPVILVIERSANIHEHPMMRRSATYRTDSLDEAIFLAKRLLLPG
jgi:nucleoside 2-deoxyribosyltransferase